MKKIGYFFEDSRFGGPHSQVCYHLNSKNSKKKKNYLFINHDDSYLFVKNLKKKNIKFSFIKISPLSLKITKIFKYLFFFLNDILKILKIINEYRLDVVIGSNGNSCIKTIIAGFLSKAKVYIHIHDTRSPFFLYFLIKFFFNLSDGLIFASKKSQNYYLQKKKNIRSIILNSSIKIFRFDYKKKYILKKKVGFFGNINDDKDVLFFLEIVKEYKSENQKKIKFILFGQVWKNQKKYFEKCQKLIKFYNLNNLELVINSDASVRQKMKSCDVLLITSKNESSPLIAREAMSAGVIIVSNFVGDLDKIIHNKVNGYLVKKTIKNYIRVINNLYKNPNKIKKIKDNCRKYANKNFNVEHYSKKLFEFF